MMMGFIAKLTVKPEARTAFEQAQIELRRLTYENEPDTPVYEMLQSREDPNVYMVVATFKDQAAFELHQKTSFHEALVPPILAALSKDMELSFYDVIT
jgi:quinol monooxygenase YgiN